MFLKNPMYKKKNLKKYFLKIKIAVNKLAIFFLENKKFSNKN
jgi:hypothetical protein